MNSSTNQSYFIRDPTPRTTAQLRRRATAEYLLKLHNIKVEADKKRKQELETITHENKQLLTQVAELQERQQLLNKLLQDTLPVLGKISSKHNNLSSTKLHQQLIQTTTVSSEYMNPRSPTDEAYYKLQQLEETISDWKEYTLTLRNSIQDILRIKKN